MVIKKILLILVLSMLLFFGSPQEIVEADELEAQALFELEEQMRSDHGESAQDYAETEQDVESAQALYEFDEKMRAEIEQEQDLVSPQALHSSRKLRGAEVPLETPQETPQETAVDENLDPAFDDEEEGANVPLNVPRDDSYSYSRKLPGVNTNNIPTRVFSECPTATGAFF